MQSLDLWRLIIFASLLILFMLLEVFWPRHTRVISRKQRWPANLSLIMINGLVIKLIFPIGTLALAHWVAQDQFGLLNQLPLSPYLSIPIAIVLLDCAIYWQHRLFHAIPLLWRVHRMHHVDPDYDVSLGLRFHPIEIVLSMLIKLGFIVLLGVPVMAVFLFEVILNGMAMFNHSNLKLPLKLDAVVRKLLVTPDMHRVHHSRFRHEHNANYGFNLSIWDRLFNSYVAQPQQGHSGLRFGLSHWPKAEDNQQLSGLLSLPFRSANKK
ncbi:MULTISPECIES: sterol desaturase family protein [unclassified Agarivorans]|uniref:sterol desaturase family protein n=1 Tax=unclassified Agarivorans TaxID=2636026 RepID=UPI0026E3D7BB|nr:MULTISPECIES: sterol desaturase family protein [unclassified Agarivorans]MDO6685345.1 sterol desaturase family protein [Agarivorans sp. 3_MG-2023]MDO6715483.1 sterol desaturase family protein [Agarivorans sp. 2_MG-2023]